jgi:hypothetical protein
MKPRYLLFLLPILLIALVFWAITRFPDENSIGRYALKYLSDELQAKVTVQTLALRWRPIPTLIATDLDISHANYTLKSDELSISISITDALKNGISGVSLHTLRLKRPRLHLISSSAQSELHIPSIGLLEIVDGELTISADYSGEKLMQKDLLLSHIDAQAALSSDHILLKTLQCQSVFTQSVKLEGEIDLSKDFMHLKGSAKQILPHSMPFNAVAGLDSLKQAVLDLDFEAEGPLAIKGESALNVTINGAIPELILQKGGRSYEFAVSNLALHLQIFENGYSMNIPDITATKPQLELKGIVKKQADSWDIDLSASDIDLGAVRERVSGLLGQEEAAKNTCEIVLGGRARAATFAFHGTTEEMKDLNNLLITANVEKAPIFIPEANLKLDEASGPIRIERGALSGYGLSARMGNSTAFDSSLYLQITTEDDTFHLKLNLNADLAELPPILNKFAKTKGFREELGHITSARGRARGELELGPRLNDMNVWVRVQEVQAALKYDRISWPIEITRGRLEVVMEPFLVKWGDMAAKIGPHAVERLSGQVTHKNDYILTIDGGVAECDTTSLQEELYRYEDIRPQLEALLKEINGTLSVNSIKVTGPFFRPTAWQYQLKATWEKGRIITPLVAPKELLVRNATLEFTDQTLQIPFATLQIDDTAFQIKAGLFHEHLRNWRGDAAITGMVNSNLQAWLAKKGWAAPEAFTPKLPYLVQDLHIQWGDGPIKLTGSVIPEQSSPSAENIINLDITLQDHKPIKNLIEIRHATGSCILSVLWNSEKNTLKALKWKGILNQEVLDALLEKNDLLSGSIAGDFSVSHAPNAAADWQFFGKIDVQELVWHWGLPRPILIQRLIAEAPTAFQHMNVLEIKQADVKIDHETISLNGRIYNEENQLKFDLAASSNFVSWATLKTLLPKEEPNGQAPSKKRNITGTLRFEANSFLYIKEQGFCPENNCSSTKFLWSPMRGSLEFLPEKTRLTLTDSELCGIASRGTWEGSGLKGGHGSFELTTDSLQPVMAQNLMQCLGYPQHLLEGPLNIHIQVEGNPEFFEKGMVKITSSNGKIYKLTFLAKVFGLLNLTDIFKNALPDLTSTGFSYSSLEFMGNIENDRVLLEKNVIKGTGVNIFTRGSIALKDMNGDLVMIIAPFKTIDAILTKIPYIGRVLGGKTGSIVGIPVAVKGPLKDPQVNILPASAIGTGILELVTDTIKLPFRIIEPILPTNHSNDSKTNSNSTQKQ